jgi:hypothetical protein
VFFFERVTGAFRFFDDRFLSDAAAAAVDNAGFEKLESFSRSAVPPKMFSPHKFCRFDKPNAPVASSYARKPRGKIKQF